MQMVRECSPSPHCTASDLRPCREEQGHLSSCPVLLSTALGRVSWDHLAGFSEGMSDLPVHHCNLIRENLEAAWGAGGVSLVLLGVA